MIKNASTINKLIFDILFDFGMHLPMVINTL